MLTFRETHALKAPSGRFHAVGAVPTTCLNVHTPATLAEVMAGRTFSRDGATWGWSGSKMFNTLDALKDAVTEAGGVFCSVDRCACRKLEAQATAAAQ